MFDSFLQTQRLMIEGFNMWMRLPLVIWQSMLSTISPPPRELIVEEKENNET